jgi:hypothetical protein
MDRPALTGSAPELRSLTEWLHVMGTLRDRLSDEACVKDDSAAAVTRELVRDVFRAENRVRAHVGLPPRMH